MPRTKFRFLWSNHEPNIFIEANINSFIKFRDVTPWNDVSEIIQVSADNDIRCFHSEKDIERDTERGKLLFDKKFINKFLRTLGRDYARHWQMFKEIRDLNVSNLSNKEIIAWLEKIIDEWSYIISYFRYSQAAGTHYLTEEIKKYFVPRNASLLMLPTEVDDMNLELLAWQKIVKNSFSEKIIINHAARYPWIVMNHYSYGEVLETLKQRYAYDKLNLTPKNIAEEKAVLRKKQEVIISKHPEAKSLVNLAQRIAVTRIAIKSCWAGSDFYLIPFYQEISKRTHERVNDLWKLYLLEDLKKAVNKGELLSAKEKSDRKRCFAGHLKNKKFFHYSGIKAEQVAKRELGPLYKEADTKILRGTPANPGKSTGVVRVLRANDVENTRLVRKTFQKGEILVTQMTQPNVMDIASKAAAIITDEGGMLSHAAIISRELHIPCVVGTHYATRVLKDGDLVEVDAYSGIVKKI
ncbi:MAG: PEP-utilizing enzyme [Candidatus Staskawiczbacteria bacterium]|jgi:phosphohistidine swiveling domain-containing protein